MNLSPAARIGRLLTLTLALAASLGLTNVALAQATKVETKAKEKAKTAEPAKGLIDLNSATIDELQTLPGVGPAYARKIIDSRPHKAVADLAGAGVPATTIEKLKPLIEVKPLPAPVDVNVDPIDKLETLPGVGPAIAKEIIAARPHAGYESIAKLKGIGPEKLDALKGRVKFGTAAPTTKPEEKPKAKTKDEMPKKAAEAKSEPKAKVAETKKEAAAPKLAPGTKVNINTATKEVLDELPGIGPVKAQAILDYRAEKKFESIEDIMKVKGIKDGEFCKIKDLITVQ
jgi:competence protein ComEA